MAEAIYGEAMSMEYQYYGLELTPAIFRELLIQFFDGKQFARQNAIDEITTYHVQNGGILKKTSYISVFKKASQNLREMGMKSIGYGIWRLAYEKKEITILEYDKKQKEISISADKEIGEGKQSIYVYFYNGYKKLAEIQGKNVWECKIGRTDVDSISRVFGQAGTCYPELPHIAIIFYCDDSMLLEKAFHTVLKVKNRWISTAPGTEWFMTSPEEIEKIYYAIVES